MTDSKPDSSNDLLARVDDFKSGRISATERVENALSTIAGLDPTINAFHDLLAEEARSTAKELDATRERGDDLGPLAGSIIAIKDNICMNVGRTTCSSRMLEEYRSPFDATVIERLRAAGAILLGKTNLDEFAMGSSSEHCAWGPVRNPHATDRVPGGSSGGSAAAVAADCVDAALGSDTGGSIRQPAAFCGTVGFKPTYGRVSRHGLVAFGSSLDQIGPLSRSVRDAAAIYEAIAGLDPADSTTSDLEVANCLASGPADPARLRVGIPREHRNDRNHAGVNEVLDHAVDRLRAAGATIVDVDLPLTRQGVSTYYVIAPAEASSNLTRFDGIRYGHRAESVPGEGLEDLYARTRTEGFGDEVRRRILLGTYVLSAGYYDAYYKRALQVRRLIKQEYDSAFEQCDVLLGPTTPTPAFPIGADLDPVSMYLNDVYTVNSNIAGIPALSIPAGLVDEDGEKLPVGVHLQAPAFAEADLLAAAAALESLLAD
ncbi:MAG: Asp-tRNA(Asn)/Glu-tRNA(Gln) amidotransferase GatCAB subunit A [Phycisphaerae bacterium]|nr:Asp-tRNA(Asn)/Glu-tRNA(Gln) amidotransferase GatCAB subunit A [Phycisphaerae bacterium]